MLAPVSPEPTSAPQSPGVREALLTAARAELTELGHAAISLRAIARRAGVSHAAPKHHFHDRAGLLTAIATEGFGALTHALTDALRGSGAADPRQRIAVLGRAYIDFGLAHPALFDLMFRPTELHADDPALGHAQHRAIATLGAAVNATARADPASPAPDLALVCWALAHGLTVLTRDGALPTITGTRDADTAAGLARHLTDIFTAHVDPG